MASGNLQYGNNGNIVNTNNSGPDFTTLASSVTTTVANEATLVVQNDGQGNTLRVRSGPGYGVRATSNSASGVFGSSTTGAGLEGQSGSNSGVFGETTGTIASGVAGRNLTGFGWGVSGKSNAQAGDFNPRGAAVLGENFVGYAGLFVGQVFVQGGLAKYSGGFQIDHPLDLPNRFLCHSFVESPEMTNVYCGIAITGSDATATVALPDYFDALNRDPCYQLTCIGDSANAFVADEVENNQFTIKTDKPNVKVSWQVTGIRQDAWANAHRIQPEVDKPAQLRGRYLTPEEHGQPPATAIYKAIDSEPAAT